MSSFIYFLHLIGFAMVIFGAISLIFTGRPMKRKDVIIRFVVILLGIAMMVVAFFCNRPDQVHVPHLAMIIQHQENKNDYYAASAWITISGVIFFSIFYKRSRQIAAIGLLMAISFAIFFLISSVFH